MSQWFDFSYARLASSRERDGESQKTENANNWLMIFRMPVGNRRNSRWIKIIATVPWNKWTPWLASLST